MEAGEVVMAPSPLNIEARADESASFFNRLVSLIPAKYYLPDSDEQALDRYNRFLQNKSGKAPKQALKERARDAKRLKLDPDAQKTVTDIQAEEARKRSQADAGEGGASDDDDSGDEDDEPRRKQRPASAATGWTPATFSAKNESISVLQQRLHARIEALRGKRKAPSGAAAETKKEERRADNANKKKRAREEKDKKALVKGHPDDERPAKRARGDNNKPSIVNEKGEVVFSKFDFGKSADDGPGGKKKKKKKKGADVKSLLQKAEKEKKRIEELKATDAEKAKAAVEKKAWRKALDMAEGVKVKDDPKLLKKALKRKEKEKKRSEKHWAERKDAVEQAVAKRQEQRTRNIQERIQQKKDRRMGKKTVAKKGAGKKRAGFEGKKAKFAKPSPK